MVRTASQVVLHPAGSNESITVGQGRSAEPSLEVLLQDLLQDPHHGDIGDLVWRWARQRPAHVPVALAIRAHRREQEALQKWMERKNSQRVVPPKEISTSHCSPSPPHSPPHRGRPSGPLRARTSAASCCEKESEVRSDNDSEEEETYLAMSDIKHLMLGMPVEKYALETSAMFACFTVSPSPLP